MSYVQVSNESFDLIKSLKQRYPQYQDLLENIDTNLNLRLWHQLSDDLIALSEKPELKQGTDLIELYNRLIMSIEKAFNPMKLMVLIQNVSKNFSRNISLISDNLEEALVFLDNIEQRVDPKGEEHLFLKVLKVI